jgi:hypothetical protein
MRFWIVSLRIQVALDDSHAASHNNGAESIAHADPGLSSRHRKAIKHP